MLYLKIADCEMCGKHLPLKRLKAYRKNIRACNLCSVHFYREQRERRTKAKRKGSFYENILY